MADIKPFKIAIPDADLDDLNQRLGRTRLPKCPTKDVDWEQGVPSTEIERLVTYWRDDYDWRKHEANLNLLPHFTTPIQCDGFEPLDIHFIHVRSPRTDAIPLLIVHGWPGSFYEAAKVLHPLANPTSPDHPAFHVVVISLPHYGFSSGTTLPGFSSTQYATTCHLLMQRLSYTHYATQGGDWGYLITRTMSVLFPQNCLANHTNMDSAPLASLHALLSSDPTTQSPPLDARELTGLARTTWFTTHGSGYSGLQTTKPASLGFLLADSPAGLLAWIYEKLHDWTDAYPWTPDEICTWLSIFWFSTCGPAASVRIYYEFMHEEGKRGMAQVDRAQKWNGDTPLGISHSPRDVFVLPKRLTDLQGKVVFERYWEKGGHFFAWENPEGLVGDLREMFGQGCGAEGVVKGARGF